MARKKKPDWRPKRDTVNPCAICGWAEHMAIHQLLDDGPRAGQPYDHAYQPMPTRATPTKESP